MKRFLISMTALFVVAVAWAQRPFEGSFSAGELGVKARLNLYADSIPVPGLEMDSCFGYLQGQLNGTWVVLKVKELREREALVRAVSDRGSDAQDLLLRLTDAADLTVRLVGEANMRGISGRKYVKLPKVFEMKRE